MNTVTHTTPADGEVRPLAYRYYTYRPHGEGLSVTEWMIESQLTLAHDYGEPSLRDAIVCFRPELDETLTHALDELLDLADDVERWRQTYPLRYFGAVDAYKDALNKLAVLLRGGAR